VAVVVAAVKRHLVRMYAFAGAAGVHCYSDVLKETSVAAKHGFVHVANYECIVLPHADLAPLLAIVLRCYAFASLVPSLVPAFECDFEEGDHTLKQSFVPGHPIGLLHCSDQLAEEAFGHVAQEHDRMLPTGPVIETQTDQRWTHSECCSGDGFAPVLSGHTVAEAHGY
jgi:hypothetical protein